MVGGEIKVVMTLDNKDFSIKTVQAGKVINDLKRSMEQTAASTKAIEDRFNSFGQKFRDVTFTISILRFALQDVNDILLALPRAVIGASSEIERMTKLLEGLSTGADDAAKKLEAAANVKFVFDLAKNAPFEVGALTDSFVKLKSAGLDPTDGSLKALVDSVARFGGSSEQLKRASVAIQQMAGKGVISMEELRQQLGEAVPNAMQLMADGMGVSMAELVKRISKGEVEAKTALTQMTLMMEAVNGGAAEKMMDTWMGQVAQLKTSMTLLFAEIGGAGGSEIGFFSEVKTQLESLNTYLQSSEMKTFARDLGYAMGEVAKGFADVVRFVYQFRDEIALAGKAYLAYFAVSKVNQFRAATVEAFVAMRKAVTDYMNEAVQGERRKLAQESSIRMQRIAAEAAAARQELEILRKKHAEGLAMENAYRANWERLDQRAQTLKTARARQRSAEMASHQFQLAMAQERANAATAKSITNLEAVSVSAFGRMKNETALLKKGFEAVSLASVMMGRAISGLRAIFAALGGWIGVTITLLATAASYWVTFGDDAEEAVKRANDAIKNGYATLDDYATKQKELRDNSLEQVKLAEKIANFEAGATMPGGGMLAWDKKTLDKMKAELKKLEDDSRAILRGINEAKTQGDKHAADESLRITESEVETKLKTIRNGFRDEYNERMAAVEEIAKSDVDARKAAQEKFNKWKSGAAKKMFEDEFAMVKAMQTANDASLKKAQAGTKQYEELKRKAEAFKDIVKGFNEKKDASQTLGSGITTIAMPKEPKTPADSSLESTLSPIQQLINDLAAKREDLKAELAGFEGDVAKLSYVLNNTLQYTGKKSGAPSQAEIDKALQTQVVVDKLKQDMKALDDYQAVIERIKSSQSDINTVMSDAMEAFSAGDTAAPRHLTALNKTLADYKRALVELAEGGGEAARLAQEQLKNWSKTSSNMSADANFAQLLRDLTDYSEKAKQIEAGLDDDDRISKRNRETAELEHQRTLLEIRRDAAMASGEFDIRRLMEIEEAMKKFQNFYAARMKQIARESRTPMQRLADEWRKVTKQLEDATANWANQTIDMLMEFVKTGKLEFKELVESILTDILRIQMQKQLAGTLESVFGELTKVLGDVFGMKTSSAKGPTPAYDAQKNANRVTIVDGEASQDTNVPVDPQQEQKGFFETLKAKFAEMWKGVKDMFGSAWESISGIFSRLGDGLNGILGSLGSTMSSLFSSLSGALGNIFSSSGSGLADAAGSFLGGMDWGSIGSSLMSWFGFANGGIMSAAGAIDLKKYANGGIATRPQLALFGEGSMNEAFVPLPDGRSIPVTMTGNMGGGGAVVNVNVIEGPGTQAEVRESKGADGSTQIDVIIKQVEDKISQNLSKGRGSLASTMERTYGLNRAAGAYR